MQLGSTEYYKQLAQEYSKHNGSIPGWLSEKLPPDVGIDPLVASLPDLDEPNEVSRAQISDGSGSSLAVRIEHAGGEVKVVEADGSSTQVFALLRELDLGAGRKNVTSSQGSPLVTGIAHQMPAQGIGREQSGHRSAYENYAPGVSNTGDKEEATGFSEDDTQAKLIAMEQSLRSINTKRKVRKYLRRIRNVSPELLTQFLVMLQENAGDNAVAETYTTALPQMKQEKQSHSRTTKRIAKFLLPVALIGTIYVGAKKADESMCGTSSNYLKNLGACATLSGFARLARIQDDAIGRAINQIVAGSENRGVKK